MADRDAPRRTGADVTIASAPRDRRGVVWFIAWILAGAGYALGVLSAPSIGLFVLLITVVATIVLSTRPGNRVGLPGLVSGLSLPLFYVAYLNRSGPGTICTTTATSQTCSDEWSPWPWLNRHRAVPGGLRVVRDGEPPSRDSVARHSVEAPTVRHPFQLVFTRILEGDPRPGGEVLHGP